MSGRLKMKCARITAGCAKDDYWFASDLLATMFGQTFSSARKQMLFFINPWAWLYISFHFPLRFGTTESVSACCRVTRDKDV